MKANSSIFKLLLSCGLVLGGIPSCIKDNPYSEAEKIKAIVYHLNENVNGLSSLAQELSMGNSISDFACGEEDGFSFVRISFNDGITAKLYNDLNAADLRVPVISITHDEEGFCLHLWGCEFKDGRDGIEFGSINKKPVFSFQDGVWSLTGSGESNTVIIYDGKFDTGIVVDYCADGDAFSFTVPGQKKYEIPCSEGFALTREDVLNDVYYKDIFLDAGIGLHSRNSLAAADYLDLTLEGIDIAGKEAAPIQNRIIGGEEIDENGRLLYPDGQPRYRLFFAAGGNSRTHGQSFSTTSLERMRSFYESGGSYVGACAGAFFASKGYDDKPDYPYYLGLAPVVVQHTGLNTCRTGMFVEIESPLLEYYDFGGDHYVDRIYHSGGGYSRDFAEGVEVLARYDLPEYSDLHLKPSLWSYKRDNYSGRAVLIGSHPEIDAAGERRDLMASMIRYALDGRGMVPLKGVLNKGEPRVMDKLSSEEKPEYSRIGDLQCHHFAFFLPFGAKNIRITAESDSECNLLLMANDESYAFPNVSLYQSESKGNRQVLSFTSLKQGVWYVSVQCLTTVDVVPSEYGQEYKGRVDVLNGIPYTVKVTWE